MTPAQKGGRFDTLGMGRLTIRASGSSHPHYPSEKTGPRVVVAIPAGRCVACKAEPLPCAWCVDINSRCPGCNRLQCIKSNVFCPK